MFKGFTPLFKRFFDKFYYAPVRVAGCEIRGRVTGLKHVVFEGQNKVPNGCTFSGSVKIGFRTTLGMNNWVHGRVNIGKYCQLGADVMINSTNHPVRYLSTYINKNLFKGELYAIKETKDINIGHDVWVGHGAILLGQLNIGNGAIIAAGAVVTKDVPPFAIVAGIPAKVVGTRFTENVCREIEELAWWDKSDDELQKIKPLFFRNLEDLQSIYES